MRMNEKVLGFSFTFSILASLVHGQSLAFHDEAALCVRTCHRRYHGDLATTITGKSCRQWRRSDVTGRFGTPDLNEMSNKCRNPEYKQMPYCFVSDTEWEFCFQSTCQDSRRDTNCGLEGFHRFDGTCYRTLAIGVKNRRDARDLCQGLSDQVSVQLAELSSEDETRFVRSLTCLPGLLAGKRIKGRWKWKKNSRVNWGIENGRGVYPWCRDYPKEEEEKDCLILQANHCFQNIECKDSEEKYYPTCQVPPTLAKYTTLTLPSDLTWGGAVESCEAQGKKLCSRSEICDLNEGRNNFFRDLASVIPTERDHWVPISDEYNDWIYVGLTAGRQCARQTVESGPGGNRPRGLLICCRKQSDNDTVRLEASEPVVVYVRSAAVGHRSYYKYSLNRDNTVQEITSDRASWWNAKRNDDDLSSFTLMSHYRNRVAEKPIYFCRRNITISRLRTVSYAVSDMPCSGNYDIDFYLYGSAVQTDELSQHLFVESDSSVPDVLGNARITNNRSGCCGFGGVSFSFYSVSAGIEFQTKQNSPCDSLLKLREVRGIISSSGYPQPDRLRQGEHCRWRIRGPGNSLVRFNFTQIDLETSNHDYYIPAQRFESFRLNRGIQFNHRQNCPVEYVEVRSAKRRASSKPIYTYGTFCGSVRPPSFITTGNPIVVERMNIRNTARSSRFSLRYEILPPPFDIQKLSLNSLEFSWIRSRQQCQFLNKDLCLAEDICKYGGRPFYGVERGSNYAPVLDEYNDWIHVGHVGGQICQRHNAETSPPLWGITSPRECEDDTTQLACPAATTIYCCKKEDAGLPPVELVHLSVYTAYHNGIVFNRYLREGIDSLTDEESLIWRSVKTSPEDILQFQLVSNYRLYFSKLVTFCSKRVFPAIGRITRIYTISENYCPVDWKLQFYLYGGETKDFGSKALYVGVSDSRPPHSRLTFNHFKRGYEARGSFVVHGYSLEDLPEITTEPPVPVTTTRATIRESRCNRDPLPITAPATVTTLNYPLRYANQQSCQWLVILSEDDRSRNSTRLKLTLLDVDIEEAFSCVNDRLIISTVDYDANTGALSNEAAGDRYCGQDLGSPLITPKSFLLKFFSDASLGKRGFRLKVEVISDSCGGRVTQNGADITSPGYPIAYPGGLDCTWDLSAPNAGYTIELQFVKFHLLNNSQDCSRDSVTISSPGVDADVRCGITDPPRLYLDSNRAAIRFVTQPRAEGERTEQGFSAYVYFIPRSGGLGGGRCGVADIAPFGVGGQAGGRIVGGSEAVPGSWPWVAMIDGATCGGALINERWVLTAGHCLVPRGTRNQDFTHYTPDVSKITVYLGRHVRDIPHPEEQSSKIEEVFIHPSYMRGRPESARPSFGTDRVPINDIALLRLASPARLSERVKLLCLPTSDVRVGTSCAIAGWGTQGIVSSLASRRVLRYAQVPILDSTLCNTFPALAGAVSETNICAGLATGGIDSCKGDSGGPLMCQGADGAYYAAGVVSWGKNCGVAQQPGIYTRVWSYYEWIAGHVFRET